MSAALRVLPAPVKRARRVLGYARVSSEEQGHGSSLRDQQAALAAYAEAKGLPGPHFYVESESAIHEKNERRERIRALMAEVREGDLVVCDKIDRWSRDPEFTYRSIREILACGASFYAVGDQCDPSTPEGDTMLNFRVLFAKEEHKRIKARMVGTRKLLRDRGYYAEGLPPWGYRRAQPKGYKGAEKNVLQVEESEAKLVRQAFALCIQGRPLSEIARSVGRPLYTIGRALRRRIYIGELQNSGGEWIKGRHDPLVDVDTFARAGAALDGRRHGQRPGEGTAETHDWILRDVARCALCGARMSAAYNGGEGEHRRHYYRCFKRCTSRYVPVRATEAEAERLIVARLEELREELAAEPKRSEPSAPAPDVEGRRARLQRRREKHLEAHAADLMTLEELRAAIAKLDAERLRLDGEEQAARRTNPLDAPAVRRSVLLRVGAVRRAWTKATPEQKRMIVGDLSREALLAKGAPCRFVWRPAEELAENI